MIPLVVDAPPADDRQRRSSSSRLQASFVLGFAVLGPLVTDRGRHGGADRDRGGPLRAGRRSVLDPATAPPGGDQSGRGLASTRPRWPSGPRSTSCARAWSTSASHRNIFWSLTYLAITASLIGVLGVLGPGLRASVLGPVRERLRDHRAAARRRPGGRASWCSTCTASTCTAPAPHRGRLIVHLPIALLVLGLAQKVELRQQTRTGHDLAADRGHRGRLRGRRRVRVRGRARPDALQEELPSDVRGRVFGVLNTLVSLASFLPIIIVGPVADVVGHARRHRRLRRPSSRLTGVASILLRPAMGRATAEPGATWQPVDPVDRDHDRRRRSTRPVRCAISMAGTSGAVDSPIEYPGKPGRAGAGQRSVRRTARAQSGTGSASAASPLTQGPLRIGRVHRRHHQPCCPTRRRAPLCARLDGAAILARTPGLDDIAADVEPIDWGLVPASHLRFDQILDIARLLSATPSREPTSTGAVVVQGTDVIEETAFAFDLLVDVAEAGRGRGAMRNAGDPGYEGPANLRDAVRVAAAPALRGRGPLVVMGGSDPAGGRRDQDPHRRVRHVPGAQPRCPSGWVRGEGVTDRAHSGSGPARRCRSIPDAAAEPVALRHGGRGDRRIARCARRSRAAPAGVVVAATGPATPTRICWRPPRTRWPRACRSCSTTRCPVRASRVGELRLPRRRRHLDRSRAPSRPATWAGRRRASRSRSGWALASTTAGLRALFAD